MDLDVGAVSWLEWTRAALDSYWGLRLCAGHSGSWASERSCKQYTFADVNCGYDTGRAISVILHY